jgi:putative photosynthetic complex assembly protein
MSEIDKEPFPKIFLYGVGVVLTLAIAGAALGRYNAVQNPPASAEIQEPVEIFVDLQFFDEEDGSVIIKNAASSETIMTLLPSEDAFISAVLRGFVRDRLAQKLDREIPFRLYRLVDTRLVIEDRATMKRINLRAFGPTQQAAFERLLPAVASK